MKTKFYMKKYLIAFMISVMVFGSALTVNAAVSSETKDYIVEN